MSLLDAFNNTPITVDWLMANGWSILYDYNLYSIPGSYTLNVFTNVKRNRGYNVIRTVPIEYHIGTKTLTIWKKTYVVETVEDMYYVIDQLFKKEGISRIE